MNMTDKFNLFDLKQDNKTLLGKYVTFFKSKQDKFVKEIKLVVEDFKNEK
jgi:hypothetical protein